MYEISINGEVLETTPAPGWVYWREDLLSWCFCGEGKAEAIFINGDPEKERDSMFANIAGRPVARAEFPTAMVKKAE